MECQESVQYHDGHRKNVSTEFLHRIFALSFDFTNPLEKDPICWIQLEKFISS